MKDATTILVQRGDRVRFHHHAYSISMLVINVTMIYALALYRTTKSGRAQRPTQLCIRYQCHYQEPTVARDSGKNNFGCYAHLTPQVQLVLLLICLPPQDIYETVAIVVMLCYRHLQLIQLFTLRQTIRGYQGLVTRYDIVNTVPKIANVEQLFFPSDKSSYSLQPAGKYKAPIPLGSYSNNSITTVSPTRGNIRLCLDVSGFRGLSLPVTNTTCQY